MRLPKYVYRQEVKGRIYYRFRRPGMIAKRLPGIPGTPPFDALYTKFLGADDAATNSNAAALRYLLEESLPRARQRAAVGNLPFDLTPAFMEETLARQQFRCAVSGLPFHLSRSGRRKSIARLPFRPSIDRIEPNLGYIQGNVRVLCFAVNMAIADWGDDVFLEICRAAVKRRSQC